MSELDKNILKALKGLKPTDFTKAQPIDSKTAKVVAKIEKIAGELGMGKLRKMNMGGVIKGRGGSFKGTR